MAQTLYTPSVPNSTNATINSLPVVLWSTNRFQPQFKYVIDVYYSGSGQRLNRYKITNNASFDGGAGTIDLAPLINPYLITDQPWTVTGSIYTDSNALNFEVLLGEEYSTTTSSSVIIYNGYDNAGDPAVSMSILSLYPAVNEYDAGSYNWDYTPYSNSPLTNQPYFSQANPKIVYDGDYETLSFMNPNALITSISASIEGDGGYYAFDYNYTASGSPLPNLLRHIGVGPQNLADADAGAASFLSSTNWETISYTMYIDGSGINSYWLKNGGCSDYEVTRFAFINKLGVFDYYNITYPVSKETKVERESYTRPHTKTENFYSENGIVLQGGPVYNINDRGKIDYYLTYEDNFEITTEYIGEDDANWLTELFDSPDVFIQGQYGFEPVIINSTTYNWKTNKKGQKRFQYKIGFQLANKRINRG